MQRQQRLREQHLQHGRRLDLQLIHLHPASLLVVGYEGHEPPPPLLDDLAEGRRAGVILFSRNIAAVQQTAISVSRLGAAGARSGLAPIVSIDQEGGRVQRLREPLTRWPAMARVGAMGDPALTERVGRALGAELRRLGFNLDFAPVLDVRTNPDNDVIGDRAFGRDPEAVAAHAVAFFRGLEAAGVRGCGKHFPGHGDTREDSHLELPRLDAPVERIEAVELVPFRAAVAAGFGMIMTAHIVQAQVDALPATLSARWIDGTLRAKLGFSGVVVSDDLDMKAVAGRFSAWDVVRLGLLAGVDLFLACRDAERQRAAAEALEKAAGDPELAPRVEAALGRVEAFRRTLAPAQPLPEDRLAAAFPDEEHRRLAAEIA